MGRWASAFVIGSALSVVVAGCSSGDSVQPSDEVSTTTSSSIADHSTTTPAVAEAPSTPNPDVDVALDWTLEASFDGSLQQPTAWAGGGAAVFVETPAESLGGALWLSEDGINWGPGDDPPPGEVLHIDAGPDGSLFVVTDRGDQQTLWTSNDAAQWQEIASDEHGIEVAIGPERSIAYRRTRFNIIEIFDTDTFATGEIGALPEVDTFVYQGRVAALDDGFLLDVSWVDEEFKPSERRLLASTDGSSWVETDAIDVRVDGAATHNGATLIQTNAVEGGAPAGLWRTEDGATFAAVPQSAAAGRPIATSEGFFVVGDAQLRHSDDGIAWAGLETPATWDLGRGMGGNAQGLDAFYSGQMLVIDDHLIAVTIRGEIGGWGEVYEPQTEIWRAPSPSDSAAGAAFDSESDDLCEWVTGDDLIDFLVAAGAEVEGPAMASESADEDTIGWSCAWTLASGEEIQLGAVTKPSTGHSTSRVSALQQRGAITEYEQLGDVMQPGAAVSGHPELSEGVVVENQAFLRFSLYTPDGEKQLNIVLFPEDGVTEDPDGSTHRYETAVMAAPNAILEELGWIVT